MNDLVAIDTEGKEVSVADFNQSMEITKAEVDIQIATAKEYPRDITTAKNQALSLACLDKDVAASCFYSLTFRKGKPIEGPSIRLAEIVGSSWGNLRYGARIVSENRREGFVVAQGICHDLEKNVAIAIEVTRSIKGADGKTYSNDMITVTKQAAMAIALRNAIFKVVPFALVKPIYEQAKKASLGEGTIEQKRESMFAAYKEINVTQKTILDFLGVKGKEGIGVDQLIQLAGTLTAIRDGETTAEQAFAKDEPAKSDLNHRE